MIPLTDYALLSYFMYDEQNFIAKGVSGVLPKNTGNMGAMLLVSSESHSLSFELRSVRKWKRQKQKGLF